MAVPHSRMDNGTKYLPWPEVSRTIQTTLKIDMKLAQPPSTRTHPVQIFRAVDMRSAREAMMKTGTIARVQLVAVFAILVANPMLRTTSISRQAPLSPGRICPDRVPHPSMVTTMIRQLLTMFTKTVAQVVKRCQVLSIYLR